MEDALKPAAAKAKAVGLGMDEIGHPLLGQRVLLVDSDVRAIYSISALLDEQGLQVVPATTHTEALERFDEDAFDLALVDISVPDNGGASLIRQLRSDYGCQVPIVAMVVGDLSEGRDKSVAAGADDVLLKPVEPAKLVELLRRCLEPNDGSHESP